MLCSIEIDLEISPGLRQYGGDSVRTSGESVYDLAPGSGVGLTHGLVTNREIDPHLGWRLSLGISLPLQLLVGQSAKLIEDINMLLQVLASLAGRPHRNAAQEHVQREPRFLSKCQGI